MNRQARSLLALIGAGILATALTATATTITSTAYVDWSTNIAGPTTDVGIPGTCNGNCSGITLDNFTLTGLPNGLFLLPSVGSSGLFAKGTEIDIANSDGVNAIYLDLGLYNKNNYLDHGGTLTVILSDNESFSSVAYGVFALSLSHPITSLRLISNNAQDEPFIHGLAYAVSSLPQDTPAAGDPPATDLASAPEGKTSVLIGGGLFLLLGVKRKFIQKAVA